MKGREVQNSESKNTTILQPLQELHQEIYWFGSSIRSSVDDGATFKFDKLKSNRAEAVNGTWPDNVFLQESCSPKFFQIFLWGKYTECTRLGTHPRARQTARGIATPLVPGAAVVPEDTKVEKPLYYK